MTFEIGKSASIQRTFTQEDVETFAQLCGDSNPVHIDEAYAAGTIFKKRVVHGALVNSLFSTLLGTQFPGNGSIYMSQETSFKSPVYPGDKITAKVELQEIKGKMGVFATTASNEIGKVVVEGQAIVRLPR